MVDFENDIKQCIRSLEAGETILYPTDTIWGLGCDALNPQAVDRVFELKQRPREKSMIVLLAEARDILQYVAAPPPDIIEMVEAFSEPTTLIFEGALGFPDQVVSAEGTVAIRIPRDPFCKALLKRLRKPLISTSANLSGQPSPGNFAAIDSRIKAGAGYVVQYRQDDPGGRTPSRLARIQNDGSLLYLR
jgi:L-threonylcarbamoyladenylate synthase